MKKNSLPFDILIGKRISLLRKERKVTLKDLAKEMGITYQQLQKYETGENRTPISRLIKICSFLGVSIQFFLSEVENSPPKGYRSPTREEADLIDYYNQIKSSDVKRELLSLAKALAGDR